MYRVFHFCRALAGDAGSREDALAAVFHDLGIWSDGTVDYLPPSVRRLREHLARIGRDAEGDELARMVALRHKLRPCRGERDVLVEAFRRAGLVDLSFGLVRFGLPRAFVGEVRAAFPLAGFHRRILGSSPRWQVAEKGPSASLLGRSLVRRSSATPPRSLPRA